MLKGSHSIQPETLRRRPSVTVLSGATDPACPVGRFMAGFEQACQQRGIHLFVLHPGSHAEEFWDCYDGDLDVASSTSQERSKVYGIYWTSTEP